jgi:hypothetical protein
LALFSGRDFGSGFATFALIVFVFSVLSGQWQIAIGTLIAVLPTAPDRRKRFTVIEGGKD